LINSMNGAYLLHQIENHVRLFFTDAALSLIKAADIRFVRYADAIDIKECCLIIPIDIDSGIAPQNIYKVPFNDTVLTLWSPLPQPDRPGWRAIPNDNHPLWYVNDCQTIIPATNIFKIGWDLLTFREDNEGPRRDKHGRFNSPFSPRLDPGLLEIPVFNEAVALMLAACKCLSGAATPDDNIGGLIAAPVVNLSHDCDVLYGNDFWTQAARFARIFMPSSHGLLSRLSNIRWMAGNTLHPGRYYFNNVIGMINLEKQYGFKSTLYMLNGSGGRYGSRNGLDAILKIMAFIPDGWETGLHYNYNTYGDSNKLKAQASELQAALRRLITAGRAHYLLFDHTTSFDRWREAGINIDESVGYSKHIGYRCGLAGCFQPYNNKAGKAYDIFEAPLAIMDTTLVDQYGDDSISHFESMLKHLSRIGGAMNIVFHPGTFFNPEMPRMLGIYHKILMTCRDLKSRCLTADDMLKILTKRG